MSSEELRFCKKQLAGWKTQASIHEKKVKKIHNCIAATSFAVDIAVIAGLSAITMGAAAKLGAAITASEGAMGAARATVGAVTVADSMAVAEAGAVLYRTDQVARVLLGVAAGSTQRLSQQQLAQALAGLSARLCATTVMSLVATGVKLHMDGKPRTKGEIAWEVSKALMLSWAFAWIGSPGPKTDFQSKLLQRITKQAPHIVNEIGKLPSNQTFVMAYKLTDRTYKAIFSGEFDVPKVKRKMVESGFDLNKSQKKISAEVLKQTKVWAMESAHKLEKYIRNYYKTKDFDKEVPWYVDMAHSWREVLGGDTTVAKGLELTTTEYAVSVNQVKFWEAAVQHVEALSAALANANPAPAK